MDTAIWTTVKRASGASGIGRQIQGLLVLTGCFLALAVGCSDDTTDDKAVPGCIPGTVASYDPKTGAYVGCVPAPDSGSLFDAKADAGSGTDAQVDAATDSDLASGSDTTAGTDAAATDVAAGTDASSTCPANLSSAEAWWQCVPEIVHTGKLHGEACTSDADCLYGHCLFGNPYAAYDPAIGFCSKNCGFNKFGSPTTPCAADDGNGVAYTCNFEKSKNSGNDKIPDTQPDVYKVCLRQCKTDAECLAANPALPTCIANSDKYLSVGAQKVCGKLVPK